MGKELERQSGAPNPVVDREKDSEREAERKKGTRGKKRAHMYVDWTMGGQ